MTERNVFVQRGAIVFGALLLGACVVHVGNQGRSLETRARSNGDDAVRQFIGKSA